MVSKWSFEKCYNEFKHSLKILSSETFKQDFNSFKGIVDEVALMPLEWTQATFRNINMCRE